MDDDTGKEQLPQRESTKGKRGKTAKGKGNGEGSTKPTSQPPSDTITVAAARAAVAAISEANKSNLAREDVSSVAMRNTIANIERRLDALSKRPAVIQASNFGIRADDTVERLYHDSGLRVPCSTFEEAAECIQDIINGVRDHPKRFGSRGESLVIKTNSSGIVTLVNAASESKTTSDPEAFIPGGGFNPGDTVVIAVPIHAAYKGAAIYAVDPATGVWSVIKYIAPDRDPEDISIACACLYSSLAISAPAAVTGTNVAVTAQLMLELAKVNISPLSLIPGKVGPVAEGRSCPIVVIGPEPHRMVNFTASDPSDLVKRFTPNDAQNTNLVRVPNAASLGKNRCSTFPYPQQPFALVATGASSITATAAGYSPTLTAAWGSVLALTANTDLWELRNNCDYNRHILFGDLQLDVFLAIAISSACGLHVDIYLENGDGTQIVVTYTRIFSAYVVEQFSVDTRGGGQYASYRGLIISNIILRYENFSASDSIRLDNERGPAVRLTFLDVPAQTKYLAGVITGALAGFNIAVNLEVHTEVILDPVAKAAEYLQTTNELPYDEHVFATLVRAHFNIPHGRMNPVAAASFLDTARKVLKVGGKIGKTVGGMIPGKTGEMIVAGSNAARQIGKRIKNKELFDGYQATSFGEGGQRGNRGTFQYPGVTGPPENLWALIPVIQGGTVDPEILRAMPYARMGSPSNGIVGRSGSLAMLLSNLCEAKFPVRQGCFSGEISDVVIYRDQRRIREVRFTLDAVASESDKVEACRLAGVDLIGYFVGGWYDGTKYISLPDAQDLFPPQILTSIHQSFQKADRPALSYTIRAWRQ